VTDTPDPKTTAVDYIEDGFGSRWPLCGPYCDLHVVRPGKVQCDQRGAWCPDRREAPR
jgi:hypothetical protein